MNKSDTIAIIRSLLSSIKTSCSIFKLNRDFKNETGIDIPLFGYSNIGDFLLSVPQTVKVTGIYPLQQVSLVGNEKSAHIVSLVQRQRFSKTKKRPFHNSKSVFKKGSVHERTTNIHELQKIKRKSSLAFQDSEITFSDERISNEVTLKEQNTDMTVSSNSADECNSLKNYLGIGESIPHIEMKYTQVGDYIEVRPCQIFSPHKFYFHFRKFKKNFSDFMDDLQIFYATREGIPKITNEQIRPKLICAAFYKLHGDALMWHRAEINEIVNNSQIVVNLIDNGATVRISKEHLKYLHRKFMSLPRQAVLGSLANIVPSGGNSDWSCDATKRFFDLSFERDLIAGVVHVDPKVFRMNLALSCTRGSEIHINDTLVKEGFAEFNTDILPAHFANMLKISNSPKTAKGNDSKFQSGSEKTNHTNEFNKNIANVEGNASKKLRTPVFYFSNIYNNNKKLKEMFSSVYEKKS